MGARMKKKYEAGEATKYITRAQALKKLQLNLKDFRRLCILKGVYPREPNNRKKAQKGKLDKKTLYYVKDIRFLSHEPLIWKFREFKVFMRKIKTAMEKGDRETANRLKENKPSLQLDHLVKERYPTFVDALNDLDDCLTLCFFYSTLPRDTKVPSALIALCRRLTVEFMHYVIAAKALRKVFISVKGIYYQVEIKGQTVTILINHQRGFKPTSASDVDYRIMTNFVDFYTTMLGFINFRLYHSVNLLYPPKLPGINFNENSSDDMANEEYNELVAALNLSLVANVPQEEEELQIDEFPTADGAEKLEEAKKDAEAIKRLQSLFKGLKFFVSREVPRESVVFVIRSCDGEVSWDSSIFPGATYDETDESITHQIVDRPSVDKQYLSRYYIQPQWLFDCINFRRLLPVEDYFIGATLPPHISPFVTERLGDYIPPERQMLLALERGETLPTEDEEEEEEIEEESDDDSSADDEEKPAKSEISNSNVVKENTSKRMKVLRGRVEMPDVKAMDEEEKEHYKFRELMIRNKDKRLYRSMMKNRKNREREAKRLENKRKYHELEAKGSKDKTAGKELTAKWSVQPLSTTPGAQIKKTKKDA
uniref:Pescadillo homolog n=1 Tax=Simocephalus serrulatus TaxID=117539 RepID=A0A4Y7NLT6_9CRUS|nr:EOG090X05E6 [Simocephalus serrulatus]SVE94210.1 EOG090X05E6 [Simocephalus serrulatus]